MDTNCANQGLVQSRGSGLKSRGGAVLALRHTKVASLCFETIMAQGSGTTSCKGNWLSLSFERLDRGSISWAT